MSQVPFKVFVITHRPRGEPDCERKEVGVYEAELDS